MPSLGISLFLFSLLPFESYAYSILINNNNKENVGHKVVHTSSPQSLLYKFHRATQKR